MPELKKTKQLIIATDEEAAIVNAIKVQFPNLPRYRCWLHAYRNIKDKLRTYGITERDRLQEYKTDFIFLLKQESEGAYKDALIDKMVKWSENGKVNFFISMLKFSNFSSSLYFFFG